MAKTTWLVVVSADGVVFKTFGATEQSAASAYATKLTDTSGVHRVPYYVETVTRVRRPVVGARL